jgi:hypothetical protein
MVKWFWMERFAELTKGLEARCSRYRALSHLPEHSPACPRYAGRRLQPTCGSVRHANRGENCGKTHWATQNVRRRLIIGAAKPAIKSRWERSGHSQVSGQLGRRLLKSARQLATSCLLAAYPAPRSAHRNGVAKDQADRLGSRKQARYCPRHLVECRYDEDPRLAGSFLPAGKHLLRSARCSYNQGVCAVAIPIDCRPAGWGTID